MPEELGKKECKYTLKRNELEWDIYDFEELIISCILHINFTFELLNYCQNSYIEYTLQIYHLFSQVDQTCALLQHLLSISVLLLAVL